MIECLFQQNSTKSLELLNNLDDNNKNVNNKIKILYDEIMNLSESESIKLKSTLYLVYYYSINNYKNDAESLFYLLNMKYKISQFDIYTQVF